QKAIRKIYKATLAKAQQAHRTLPKFLHRNSNHLQLPSATKKVQAKQACLPLILPKLRWKMCNPEARKVFIPNTTGAVALSGANRSKDKSIYKDHQQLMF